MRYRLRYQQQDLELTPGEFLIGRTNDCQLVLDDPLVSRNHARLMVEAEQVTVEDLGSRNGVKVNGERLVEPRVLEHGDMILIGTQEMVLLLRRDVRVDTMVQKTEPKGETLEVLTSLADKAMSLGHFDEAERILGKLLTQVQSEVSTGKPFNNDLFERAAEHAVKLAVTTGKGSWVNYFFQLYTTTGRPCPAAVVDALYEALRKVGEIDRGVLTAYTKVLRERARSLNATERFILSRLEGLERLAALK
jgi:pSer/pThr/pTyr-binding forkhead associated (FHA) protein